MTQQELSLLQELMETSNALTRQKMLNEFDGIHKSISKMIEKQQETNGKLEETYSDTQFFRWCHRNAKLAMAIFMGVVIALSNGSKQLIALIKEIKG